MLRTRFCACLTSSLDESLVRNAPCTYAHVDPVVRQERLDAIEAQNRRRTDSLQYLQGESSDLLAQVDELKHRLGLSDEELSELYAEANELALRERNDYDRLRLSQHPPPALPSERSDELKHDLRRSTRSSAAAAQDRRRMPPPAVPPSAYTRISSQGAHSGRDETGAARAMGLDAWRTSVYEEWEDDRGSESSSGASANQRFRPEGPPPLPPSDLAGRIYPAAPYHFPHTYPPPALPPIVDPPRWRLPLLPPEACAPVPPHFVQAAASEGGGWWNAPPPLW
ncbi:hypothetical protein Rhopal_000394-T1 [Rhodotorula paludigena]|uniref:Uncharacterized protein n=1 Tax=Rhodotorula paludigena TaxID=86838 RepID=A0AAV5GCF5_9BASI|nr:hypothetical protein Rhopal_000394-T1 [Rhodotorula paludigena]